jgi:multiple sugar transport system substrate-binding protein
MTQMSRRALFAGGTALALASPALAQGAGVGFMSFTYAEEPNRPIIQALLDGFAASGGRVEPIGSAWGDVQRNLLLRQRSRTLPDTAQIQDRWLPALAQLPELQDLRPILGADLAASYAPEVLSLGSVGARVVGLPFITGSVGMVANKEVLARAGVEELPRTLDAFRAALLRVRDRVPNSVPYAMATRNPGSVPLDVLLLVWAHGGQLIDDAGTVLASSDATRAAFAFMAGLMRDRLVAPEIDRPDARRLFGQANVGFYIDPPQARIFARSFSGRGEAADAFVQPMAMPVAAAGQTPSSMEWGHVIGLFRTGAAQTAWLRYLMSDDAQRILLRLGALPATRGGRALPEVTGDAYLTAWAAAVGQPRKHEIGVWANAPELSTIVTEETQAALLGQKTSDAAVAALQTRLTAAMARRAG